MDSTLVGLLIGLVLAILTIVLILWGNKRDSSVTDAAQKQAPVVPAAVEKQAPPAAAAFEAQAPVIPPVVPSASESQAPAVASAFEAKAPEVAAAVETQAPEVPPAFETKAPGIADDLVLVEGIGPRIASILKQYGISTFAQLAGTDVAALEKILRDNGLQFAKPGSWPEQARLAAEGKMDELKALQEKLIAGR